MLQMKVPKAKAPVTQKGRGKLLQYSQDKKIQGINENQVVFSWKFFDRKHEYFNCGSVEAEWYLSVFDVLQQISEMTYIEFRQQKSRRFRVHPHDWKDTTAKFDLNGTLLEQLEEDRACIQFSISQAKGRVHGFMIDNIFYIVWLDRYHNLYPDENHGGLKTYEYPVTPYEKLEIELESKNEEINKLKEEIKAFEDLLNDY